jgi:putative hydrolase of HD superfamily
MTADDRGARSTSPVEGSSPAVAVRRGEEGLDIGTNPSCPSHVVARQLEAYNARDIQAFMECWAKDAEILSWPGSPVAVGAAEIRRRHLERFSDSGLHARLISRVAMGEMVVDQEVVTRTFPEGMGTLEVVGIYEVRDGKISRVMFREGERTLAGAARGGG